ncbi:S8 family serine peptidase [Burkholderia sp. Ac-20345]|uniref:S8 family peptidase n=1 Tax=Burkholderia sp. Ac-20345 TaxID=2703891 RepID=UPI00197BFB7F|nr:S8 family serine peptidase [Burkholderia sp. Ac-20345]MBN3782142.1 S8 family serine peptidase [Burkholderia sp. Ac-20345]
MKRFLLFVLSICAIGLLANCTLVEREPDPVVAARQMRTHPERMIVLAVENPTESITLRAGSTMGGYVAHGGYSAGGSARAMLTAITAQYELRNLTTWPIPALNIHCAVLEIMDGTPREMMMAKLSDDPRVRLVEPLQMFEGLAEPYQASRVADLQRAPREIGADAVHRTTLGDTVRIALIDTGVDTEHRDLRGRIVTTRNFVDDDWQQFNRDIHGTEVAGIIAANGTGDASGDVVGIAPRAKLIVFKACWQQRGLGAVCNSLTLAKALQGAIDARAQIINLSLGGPPDPLLSALIRVALKLGIVVVGAVMPNGDLKSFPVGVSGVIAVDVAKAGNEVPAKLMSSVLYAPGRDVLTLTPGSHYDFVSGSSFAAAHVTGTVALLVGFAQNLDTAVLRSLLEDTSGPSRNYARVINACRAIAALDGGCNNTDL